MTYADQSGISSRDGVLTKSLIPPLLLLVATLLWAAFVAPAHAQTDPLVCFGQAATIVGTDSSEVLNGTSGPDVIVGLGGNDSINGRGGDDRICAGTGNDSINGGDGNDLIDAGPGGDLVQGGDGNDRMFGGDGHDSMVGGSGDDEIFGGDGNDDMRGGPGTDNCDTETSGDSSSACEADLPANIAPSDIILDDQSVPENEPGGTQVGVLSAVDPDAGDVHTFSLVAGPGDINNASFTISGNSLNTTTVFDFETVSTYSVRIQVSDGTAVFQKPFEITVTDANDPPVAVDDSATVGEDSSANPIDVLANDTDIDGGPKTISSATDPANGSVALTGGSAGAHTGLTYSPDADYCNNPPGNTLDTFTYSVNGGSTATVSVTVTCVNDPPVAVDDTATVAEDSSANPIDVLANDTDIDGGPKTITSVMDPANGRISVTGDSEAPTGVTYTPDANYCNNPPGNTLDTFTYSVNGGSSATVSVTVTCSDDPPVAVDDTATVAEDSSANPIDVLANDTDIDGGPKTISSVTDPANGSVALTGGSAGAHTGLSYSPDADYCNAPPGTDPDTFTYTLNGGSSATVSVSVACVDDPPDAIDDEATVVEDSSANSIDVLANDTDFDGGPKTISSATDPANGSVALTGGSDDEHTGLTYTPDANYCNHPPGTDPDTFTYTLNGGSIGAVSVTVTCEDDPPGALDDSATVAEDSTATSIDVLGNDTDPEGDTVTIESASNPANGTVVLTGGSAGAHTGLTYQPDADYCNTPPGSALDTFTYTVGGGSTATVSVTVNCSDDPPVAVDDSATVAEDAAATTLDVLGNDTDIDGGPKTISAASEPANGSVTLTGGSPGEHTGLTYTPDADYCNTPPGTELDTFTYTLNGGSIATVSVTVTCVDDAPVAVDDSATVIEDAGIISIDVLSNDTDIDGGPKTVASASDPANGTVGGSSTLLTYSPDADYCNDPPGDTPDTFTYTLTGGSTATVSVTVTCQEEPPVVETSSGAASYTEGDPATSIDPAIVVSHPDGVTITGATVEITGNYASAEDNLALAGVHPLITASVAGETLTLSGDATAADYQGALRAVTYSNPSEGPSALPRTVTFTVTDDNTLSSSDTRTLEVTPVNDPPTAVDDAATTDEDTAVNEAAPGVLANDTDVDPGDTKTVVALNGSGTLTGTSAEGGSVTITANGSYTYTPPAAFQALSTGESDTDSFNYTTADAAGAQSTATVNLTVEGVSDAPTAVADTFDAVGNTGLFVDTTRPPGDAGKVVTGSILANDTDPDTPHANLNVEPVTNAATALGGSITIEADGNFTYHPDDADVGATDTFTYRVCDNSPCNSATVANSTGTINLVLTGQVWYVRNNQAAGGDGTSDAPFDTLAEAEAASDTGDTVFVFDGDNTTSNLDTGYVMQTGERLVGESRPLSVDPDGSSGSLESVNLHPGTSGAQPTLTASNEDVIVLASNALVDGVDVDPSGTGGGISGGAGTNTVTVSNVNVVDTAPAGTQPGIELDGTTGVNRFTGVTVTNGGSATAIGLRINNAGTVIFAEAGTVTIATTGAKALDAAGTNMSTSAFDDITVTGSGTGAIRLNNNTGSTTLGDGAGADLLLQTTSGSTPALDVSSAGTVTVGSAGTDTISATGGPAVDIRNTNGSNFDFDSVSSTNSANDGINLDANLTTPFAALTGSISGAAGIAVDVNGGGGNVTYLGALNDGTGQTAEVTGRSGGTVTLGGNIGDGPDAGGGIVVSGNTGGAVTFSGTTKFINTGAADAVLMTSNAVGSSLVFSGGGLDIDATTGRGLEASGGGTIEVQGTSNTINTGSGVPLNISGTLIGSSDVSFQSISANGATNGIVLSNTGTSGGLTVSGTGPAGSGGTIQNIANRGASLVNTRDVSITDMNFTNANQNDGATPDGLPGSNGDENGAIHLASVTNAALTDINITTTAQHGINGVDVRNLDLTNVSISDAGNETPAAAGNLESGVYLTNLTGRASAGQDNVFNNLDVDNTGSFNVYVANGTRTGAAPSEKDKLTITGSSFDSAGLNVLSDNVTVDNFDAANFETVVTGSTFNAAVTCGDQGISTCTPDNIQVNANNNANVKATIQSSTFTNAGQAGINISASGAGQMAFDVLNNSNVTVRAATGINLAAAGSADLRGSVSSNTIRTNVGNNPGFGIQAVADGAGTSIIANVANNNIGGTSPNLFDRGIRASSRVTGTIDLTLNNNTVVAKFEGAELMSGNNTAGETARTCVNFVSNRIDGQGSFDYFLSQYPGTTFQIQGLTGSGSSAGNVVAFIQATDAAAVTPSVDVNGGGPSISYTQATCATP